MSSACPSNTASQILVDDTDPRIDYSLGWKPDGMPGKECDNTTHSSNNIPGTTANFSFEGTGIQVYGTIPPTEFTPLAAFQVDELPSTLFSFDGDGTVHYGMMFYSTTPLSFGNHTLIMTVTSNSSTSLFLDYLLYNPLSYNRAPMTSTTASSTSIAAIESTVTSTTTAIGSQPLFPAGAVAGGVAGATVIGLILGVFLMRILLHKSRRIQDFSRIQAKPDDDDQLMTASLCTTDNNAIRSFSITTSSTWSNPREHEWTQPLSVPLRIENVVEQISLGARQLGTGMRYSDPPLYVE